MNLTDEQIQAILDGAPEGWTHYCTRNRQYFRRDGNSDRLFVWIAGTESWSVPLGNRTRWLERRERLEEILTLRQEVERLKAERDEALDGLHDAATDHRDAKRELERLKAQQSEVAARAVENNTIDTIITRLYAERWSGDLSEAPVAEKRGQLQKTLQNQTDGYWSGHTAYNIAVDGGFLIDGKKSINKRLTSLGELFMAQQKSNQLREQGDE